MRTLLSALILAALASPAYAIKTITIKNSRVLLDLEGEDINVGDRLGARTPQGKPKALLVVKQVKKGRAVAAIVKGSMQQEYSVAKVSTSTKSTIQKAAWGFTAGYAMNTLSVKPSGASTISLSGSSFSLSGFYQMPLDGGFSARILGGYETLQATGTSEAAACTDSSDCKVDISYFGLESLVRYSFLKNNTVDAWAGAGLGFLFALSKDSNILDTTKITTNQTIVGTLGLDYYLNRSSFIPIQIDYAVYPDNGTSSVNQIIFRMGYGSNF